jgi:hypothetical protein
VQLAVVHLELVFLEEDNLGTLRNVNTDAGEALGLTDEGQDLAVEVDIQLVVVGMSDD